MTGAYLQVIAAQARVESSRAQLGTANALYDQTSQQFQFGKAPQLDVNRSHVEVLTEQQRLASLQNDLAKQKINLARLTGLSPTDQYRITDEVPFAPAPMIGVEDAVKQALDRRPDLKAARAQVQAAVWTLSAARDERLPSVSVDANYGAIGTNPGQAHGTYTVTGTLRVPIWQGGRVAGDIEEADATVTQRRAELEDAKAQIESQVRQAFLDLQAATAQVDVAQQSLQVNQADAGPDAHASGSRREQQCRTGAIAGVRGQCAARLHQQRVRAQRRQAQSGSRTWPSGGKSSAIPENAIRITARGNPEARKRGWPRHTVHYPDDRPAQWPLATLHLGVRRVESRASRKLAYPASNGPPKSKNTGR